MTAPQPKEPIHIVSAADSGYAPHLGAMLHSLFTSNPAEIFHLHYLHRPALPQAVTQQLSELCGRFGSLLTAVRVETERLGGLPFKSHYPEEAWYRLFLPSLLPVQRRVLWLDADLLVLHSVLELWNLELNGRPIAAVPNALGPGHWSHPAELGMSDRSHYFNTGVMLLDLEQMRINDAEAQLLASVNRYRSKNLFADQDAYNPVFENNYVALPLPWNVTGGTYLHAQEAIRVHGIKQFKEAIRNPKIVHFTQQKPWLYLSSHPYRDRYLAHRSAAGWPPPQVAGRSLKFALMRRLPMVLRTVMARPGRLRLMDLVAIVAVWLGQPRFRSQRQGPPLKLK